MVLHFAKTLTCCCWWLAVLGATATSSSSCVEEFERCVMPRDCCEGLSCVAGEWQYTTDSTCLSPKSVQLDEQSFTVEERQDLVTAFYKETIVDVEKSLEQVAHIVKKYRNEFPKLVAKLEQKYRTDFPVPDNKASSDEL